MYFFKLYILVLNELMKLRYHSGTGREGDIGAYGVFNVQLGHDETGTVGDIGALGETGTDGGGSFMLEERFSTCVKNQYSI